MDNISTQCEEIEVLSSIYGNDWCIDDEGLYHIVIEKGPVKLILYIQMPESYPSESPPYFRVEASSLSKEEINDITNILQDVYLENLGETIVFQWVEKIREWLLEKASTIVLASEILNQEVENERNTHDNDGELALLCSQVEEATIGCLKDDALRKGASSSASVIIIHGDPITYKKSTFQGHAAIISNPQDIQCVLRELMQNKKIAHATHNIHACRIFKESTNTFDELFEDDGEKQAGHRLLHLLQIMNVRNVMVVVSRWFGGVLLGPDRFRLINNAARQVLEKGNLIPAPDTKRKK